MIMKIHNKKFLFVIRYLLLILFIGYYVSITAFYHSHLVRGVVITHSHPYKNFHDKNSPFQKHQHTNSEYQFVQQLNECVWKSTPPSEIPIPYFNYFQSYSTSLSPQVTGYPVSVLHLRAPPVC
jgi:hypothetical protein